MPAKKPAVSKEKKKVEKTKDVSFYLFDLVVEVELKNSKAIALAHKVMRFPTTKTNLQAGVFTVAVAKFTKEMQDSAQRSMKGISTTIKSISVCKL